MNAEMTPVTTAERWLKFIVVGGVWLLSAVPANADEAMQAKGAAKINEEVQAIHAQYIGAFNRKDSGAVAALFTKDGIFVDGAGATTIGREAIEAMFVQGFKQLGDFTIEVEAEHVEPLGNGAFDIGHGAQVFKGKDGVQTHPFHYTVIYTREGGVLKLRATSLGADIPG
ncbi:MAG TPA: nuclear transport factor 2 family protein [Stellaceae bacterium]|nr:nuclear transport factor 2 family protein [Stellaceae bacterium]